MRFNPMADISVTCRTIVIDAGKTFQAAAVEWFPKYGLRKIDAVLITHAHADGELDVMHVTVRTNRDSVRSNERIG